MRSLGEFVGETFDSVTGVSFHTFSAGLLSLSWVLIVAGMAFLAVLALGDSPGQRVDYRLGLLSVGALVFVVVLLVGWHPGVCDDVELPPDSAGESRRFFPPARSLRA